MKIFIAIFSICLINTACSSQSPYRDASRGGYGYKETRISEQRYRITFNARGDNSAAAMDYALLRAAELSLEKGYDWFEVVDRQTEIIRGERASGSQLSASRNYYDNSVRCGLLTCRDQPHAHTEYGARINMGDEHSKVQVQLEIWMDKGVRPDSRNAYSARDVSDNLHQGLNGKS